MNYSGNLYISNDKNHIFQKYKFELLVYSTNTIRFLVVLKRDYFTYVKYFFQSVIFYIT